MSVSPAEILPQKDVSNIKLLLDAQTTEKEINITALYAATNTIYRDKLKAEIWKDLSAGMKARNMPTAMIENGEKAAGPAIDLAMDKQVLAMVDSINQGLPLVSAEETKAVGDYQSKQTQAGAGAGGAGGAAGNAPLDGNKLDTTQQSVGDPQDKSIVNPNDVYVNTGSEGGASKEAGAMNNSTRVDQRSGSWEQPQQIGQV